jgi:hypothetical protein
MRKKIWIAFVMLGFFLTPIVFADGFSATLNIGLPTFSAALGLNYSLEVLPDLRVGGGVSGFYGQPYPQIKFNLGALYGKKILEFKPGFLELYAGARVTGGVAPVIGVSAWLEPTVGLEGEYSIAPKTRLVGNLDLAFFMPLTDGATFEWSGNFGLGLKYALLDQLELGAFLNADYHDVIGVLSRTTLNATIKASYTLVGQVKIGTSLGFTYLSTNVTNFSIGIFGSFVQNPGTPGTPDTRLP